MDLAQHPTLWDIAQEIIEKWPADTAKEHREAREAAGWTKPEHRREFTQEEDEDLERQLSEVKRDQMMLELAKAARNKELVLLDHVTGFPVRPQDVVGRHERANRADVNNWMKKHRMPYRLEIPEAKPELEKQKKPKPEILGRGAILAAEGTAARKDYSAKNIEAVEKRVKELHSDPDFMHMSTPEMASWIYDEIEASKIKFQGGQSYELSTVEGWVKLCRAGLRAAAKRKGAFNPETS